MNERVKNQALYEFCAFYRQQFGRLHDATRFRNELAMRFYFQAPNSQELFDRCVEQRYIRCEAGNIIIKVNGRDNRQ